MVAGSDLPLREKDLMKDLPLVNVRRYPYRYMLAIQQGSVVRDWRAIVE